LSAEDFSAALLGSFQTDCQRYETFGLEALLPEILENFAFLGQDITVTEAPEPPYQARVKGLTPDGFLIIETADGNLRPLVAGDVRKK
jgi:biotin-(acetyl-CoA carboxylase) ligase